MLGANERIIKGEEGDLMRDTQSDMGGLENGEAEKIGNEEMKKKQREDDAKQKKD